MATVRVELDERSYDVRIGRQLCSRLAAHLSRFAGRHVALVSSPRVFGLHGRRVERELRRLGRVSRVLVPDGESSKTVATWAGLHDRLAAARFGRDGLLVALGGGVVGDVAGFAAATFMRGVDWIQLPTTLLAMVDSSVGGKTGVNHPGAKNLIGAFHQPRAVLADLDLLETLPLRELRSGAYEVLKCGLIGDPDLFDVAAGAPADWRRLAPSRLAAAVAGAVRLKAQIVAADEREGGLRRVLNLGHTLGHALEAATGYGRFTHGEAVGWGLIGAALIARRRGLLAERDYETIVTAVERLGPRPAVSDTKPAAILAALAKDKKARDGQVPFVLPEAIGRVRVQADVALGEVRAALHTLAAMS